MFISSDYLVLGFSNISRIVSSHPNGSVFVVIKLKHVDRNQRQRENEEWKGLPRNKKNFFLNLMINKYGFSKRNKIKNLLLA